MPTVDLIINAPVHVVYSLFTTPAGLTSWMCNTVDVHPYPGGMCMFGWNIGFFAAGQFKEVEANKKLVFTWWGKGDPAETLVTVTFDADGETTKLHLVHEGETGEEFQSEWERSLSALKTIAETGHDIRLGNQPMMGVYPYGQINDKNRAKYDVEHGLLLNGVIDGMGAANAGILAADVILSINDKKMTGWQDLGSAIEGKVAGDVVDVVVYRNGAEVPLKMTLSARQLMPVIRDPKELVKYMEGIYQSLNDELDALVSGVTEAEADFKPDNGAEWNLKENLAHIIWIERFSQLRLWGLTVGDGRIRYASNDNIHKDGIIAAHPTLAELVAEFKRAGVEAVTILKRLTPEFIANNVFYQAGVADFQHGSPHTREHWEQMRETIQLARQAHSELVN